MRNIEALQTVLARFHRFKSEIEKEMPPTPDPHELSSGHPALLRDRTQRTLRQTEEGVDPEEVTDPRLGDLVRDPAVLALRLRRPCIATITAAIEQARQQAAGEAVARTSGATWPRLHRLRKEVQLDPRSKPAPAGPHVHEGRLVLPGEEVLLTEQQAQAFSTKFEPVTS